MAEGLIPPTYFGAVEADVYRSEYPSLEHIPFLATLQLRTVVLLSIEALSPPVGKKLSRSTIHSQQGGADSSKSNSQKSSQHDTKNHSKGDQEGGGKSVDSSGKGKKQGAMQDNTVPSHERSHLPATTVIVHPVSSLWESQEEITDELVHAVLYYVLNKDYHPLLLTCPTGAFQTNIVVGCLRRLQRWSLVSALDECSLFLPPDGLERELRRDVVEMIEGFNIQDCILNPSGLRWLLPHSYQPASSSSSSKGTSPGSVMTHGKSPVPLRRTIDPVSVTPTGQFAFPSSLPVEAVDESAGFQRNSAEGEIPPMQLPIANATVTKSPESSIHYTGQAHLLPDWYHSQVEADREDMRILRSLGADVKRGTEGLVGDGAKQPSGGTTNTTHNPPKLHQVELNRLVESINSGYLLNHGEEKDDGVSPTTTVRHRGHCKIDLKSAKEPRLRFLRNPPTASVGVKWSKEELVEEDED